MTKKPSRFAEQLKNTTRKPQQDAAESQPRSTVEDTFRKPETPLSAQINVRVTPEFRDEVKMYSVQTGVSVQELVSEALQKYMQHDPMKR